MYIISDGVDLTQVRHQRELKARLKAKADEGWKISLTIATPCQTLSQARNRNRLKGFLTSAQKGRIEALRGVQSWALLPHQSIHD